jgi:hypothetical protein
MRWNPLLLFYLGRRYFLFFLFQTVTYNREEREAMMKKLMMLMVLVILAVFAADQAFAKPIEIHWWHAMRGARGETLKKIVDAFNASQKRLCGG